MGKLAVQKYFSFTILIITVLLMIFTITGLYGGEVNPAGNTARAMLVYALPLLIIANIIMLLYWCIMRRWHWALIPLITILCCIPYSMTIYKFGSSNENAESMKGIKIATYNVAMFSRETSGFIAQDILAEMKKQKVDIVCFQEYSDQSGDRKNSDSYKEYFPYMATGESDMVIYSRYPITNFKNLNFEMTNNSAMWAEIKTCVNQRLPSLYAVTSMMCPIHMFTTRCWATRLTALRSVARAGCTPFAEERRMCVSTISSMIRSSKASVTTVVISHTPITILYL